MDFNSEKELQDFMEDKLNWSPVITRQKSIIEGKTIVEGLTINYGPSIEHLIDIKIEALKMGDLEKARICQEIYEKYCYGNNMGSIAYTAEQEKKMVVSLLEEQFNVLEKMYENTNNQKDNKILLGKCRDFLAITEGTKIENKFNLQKLKEEIAKLEYSNLNKEKSVKRNNATNLETTKNDAVEDLFEDFYSKDVDYSNLNEKKDKQKIENKENKDESKRMVKYPIVNELITKEKYGEYAPIVQEFLNRAMNEYDLSPEFINIFAESCEAVKISKLPKKYEQYDGLTTYAKKNIRINKNILKKFKDKPNEKMYEYMSDVLNHEMMHMLLKQIPGIGLSLTEAITEVAANRTSYGKDKNNMEKYRSETLGYPNMTFGVNILAAAMGISEKEFLKLAFGHKTFETISKQIHSKSEAQNFLNEINEELEKIRVASFEEKHTIKELKDIQTKSYHTLYVKGKEYLNKRIANMEINDKNIDEVVESLKYSSNKMTQILQSELENKGNNKLKPGLNLVNGFGMYSPEKVQNIQEDQRNTLNARIEILDKMSKEFKKNSAFRGVKGESDKKIILLYIQKYALSQKDIVSMNRILKERWNINIDDIVEKNINSKDEKKFKLKPETIEKIIKDDFSTSYDDSNITLMEKAANPTLKTRLKNSFLKLKNKLFKRKSQFLLQPGLNVDGKVRPERPITTKEKYDEISKGVDDMIQSSDPYLGIDKNTKKSWVISQSSKEAINKANIRFAEKYAKNKIKNKNPKDIEHDD